MTSTRQEQRVLKLSIAATVLVAAIGFFGGMLARSQAILFDGIYSLVDVALTLVALAVLRLMAREQSPRFEYRKFKRSIRAVCRVAGGRASAGSDTDWTFATGTSA